MGHRFLRLADDVAPGAAAAGPRPLDLSAFPGRWINANPATKAIAWLELAVEGGRLTVRVVAVTPDGTLDWGEVEADALYATGPASDAGLGFTAGYDFGFMRTDLEGNLNKGLMVLAVYNRFRDGSGRPAYFTREYFAVTHDRFGPAGETR
jgi:hypothetical protein